MFSGIQGKFVLSSPGDKWAKETCAGCPQQRYIPGEPGNVQGGDRVGIVEGSWVPGPRGQYSGKNRFIEKSWVQDEGWMDELGFYVPSTVFQSFRDDGRVNMKDSVQ